MADHDRAPNMGNLDEYLMRAKSYQDRGKISVAESLAFFRGSNLPTDIVLEIADDKLEGFLVWEEFKIAVRLALRRQQKQLQSERGGGGGGGGVLSHAYVTKEEDTISMPTHDTSATDDVNISDVPVTKVVVLPNSLVRMPPSYPDSTSKFAYPYHTTSPYFHSIASEGR